MNSATLKTLRETAGISIESAAHLAGVDNATWRNLESSTNNHDCPEQTIRAVESVTAKMMNTLHAAADAAESDEYADLTLTRYRNQAALDRAHPNYTGGISAHNALIGHLYMFLSALGHEVAVVWDDDPAGYVNDEL